MFINYIPEDISVLAVHLVHYGKSGPAHFVYRNRRDSGLIYVISGNATYYTTSGSFSVGSQDVFYLKQGEDYSIDIPCEDYYHIHINFELDRETQTVFSSGVCMRSAKELCFSLFQKLNHLYAEKPPMYMIECRILLLKLFELFIGEQRQYLSSEKYNTVARAAAYIEAHLSDSGFSVEEAAEKMGMSSGYLRRLFHGVYGISPVKYLRNLRLEKAKALLLSTDRPIGEIAAECGFSGLYYFDSVFRTQTGITASEYRKGRMM